MISIHKKISRIGLVLTLALFTFSAKAIVLGNAIVNGRYQEQISIDIELFNLYLINANDIHYSLSKVMNYEEDGTHRFLTYRVAFLKSNGLGWISIEILDPVYNGNIEFVLSVNTKEARAIRKYNLKPYGIGQDRPNEPSCPFINSKRISCTAN